MHYIVLYPKRSTIKEKMLYLVSTVNYKFLENHTED